MLGPMESTPLRAWLKKRGHGSVKWMQERTGIPLRTLHRIIAGNPDVRLADAVAISEATNGDVRIKDLIPHEATDAAE